MLSQPSAVLRRPAADGVQLPPVTSARAGAGRDQPLLHRHQPFLRLPFAPDRVIAGALKARIQDRRVIDDLIAVQDHTVLQVLARDVQRGDVVAGIIIGVLQDRHTDFPFGPAVKLFLQIPDNHIDLVDPVLMQRVQHGIDHPHAVHLDKRLRGHKGQRLHALADPGCHDDRSFDNMRFFRHSSVPSISSFA